MLPNVYSIYHSSTSKLYQMQTWKMSETLPEQNCLFQDFTGKCANYVNFKIATKQRILSDNTMLTTFTSLNDVYLITTKNLPKVGHITQAG